MDEEIEHEDEVEAPVVPVVEISSSGQQQMRQAWPDVSVQEVESDQDEGGNASSDDETDEGAPTSHRKSAASVPPPKYKSVNGSKKIDMTPPDQKLLRSRSLAQKYSASGKVDKAIRELICCLAYSRIVYGLFHWRHAESMVDLAEAYLHLKGYNVQAEQHTESAHNLMLTGSHTPASTQEKADLYGVLIKIYRVMGEAATSLKKYGVAERAFQKADQVSQERSKLACVTDSQCNQLDIVLFRCMARLYAKEKKYALASEKYDKVIDLMENEYGKDSFQVMHTYMEYGKMEQSKGRHTNHDKTTRLFLQAYSIASAVHKTGHPELIDTALALSQAYANTGLEEGEASALSYVEESLSTCTAVYGPSHPKTLEVQDHLAKLMIRTDKIQDALQILKSSLPYKKNVFGDYSEKVSETYKLIGSIHLSEGDLQSALRYYKKCFDIEVILLGNGHKKTKDTKVTLDMLMSSPVVSSKFVLSKSDQLQKRPRFNSVVGRVSSTHKV